MKNILRPATDGAGTIIDIFATVQEAASEAKKEIITRHENRTDEVVLEDLLNSAGRAVSYLLIASTGNHVLSIGLQDRAVKSWARKVAVVQAIRQAAAAGISGMVLWHRHQETVMMLRAYEDEAAMYA